MPAFIISIHCWVLAIGLVATETLGRYRRFTNYAVCRYDDCQRHGVGNRRLLTTMPGMRIAGVSSIYLFSMRHGAIGIGCVGVGRRD
jgi:hypothetical protein